MSAPESPYLAFIVGTHVATAVALLVFFWRDWLRIIGGLYSSVRHRRIDTADERLAWMVVVATVPVGLSGVVLEYTFRTVLGRPVPAAVFLAVNGVLLYGAERLRRRTPAAAARRPPSPRPESTAVWGHRRWPRTGASADARGCGPVLVPARHAGHLRRRSAQAARPVRPARRRHPWTGRRGQPRRRYLRLPGGAVPDRYFETRTLTPFAAYITAAGVASLAWLGLH